MKPTGIIITLAALIVLFAFMALSTSGNERAFTLFSTLTTGACSSLYTFLHLKPKPKEPETPEDPG